MTNEGREGIVIVTGGSSGIGKAIVSRLESLGWLVYAGSRSSSNGAAVIGRMGSLTLDVTNPDSVRTAVNFVLERHGRINAIVNAAGIGGIGPIASSTEKSVSDLFETNVNGVIRMCREAVPIMERAGAGKIVNIGSLAGRTGLPYQGLYSASKAALSALTESMDIELEPKGIRAYLIEPGDFKTDFSFNKKVDWLPAGDAERHRKERVISSIHRDAAAGRDPGEIADLVGDILSGKRRQTRFVLGPLMQVFTCLAKPFLPERAFNRLVKRHFDLG